MKSNNFDYTRFESCLEKLIRFHAILRTTVIEGLQPVQQIHDEMSCIRPLSSCNEEDLNSYIEQFVTQPINLEKGPLAHFKVLKRCNGDHIFIAKVHHILVDGESMKILLRDLMTLYGNNSLSEEKRPAYSDYVLWQQEYFYPILYTEIKPYLEKKLTGFRVELLPKTEKTTSNSLTLDIKGKDFEIFKMYCKNHALTLSSVLLASFHKSLSMITNEEKTAVMVLSAGRSQKDFLNLIGDTSCESLSTYYSSLQAPLDVVASNIFKDMLENSRLEVPLSIFEFLNLAKVPYSYNFQKRDWISKTFLNGISVKPYILPEKDASIWGDHPRHASLKCYLLEESFLRINLKY